MTEDHQRLYTELAKALGITDLGADAEGAVQIAIGEDRIVLFVENSLTVTVVIPVAPLPAELDYGIVLWLLRQNHYDSPITPFRVSCNPDGNLTIWARLPIDGLSGADFALMLDDAVTEAIDIRGELGLEEEAEEGTTN